MRIACGLMMFLFITVSASTLQQKTIAAIDQINIFPAVLSGLIVSYLEGGGTLVHRGNFEIPNSPVCTLQRIDTYLACGGDGGSIHFLDVNSCKIMHKFEGHTGAIMSLAVLPNGRFASGSADETVRI